MAGIFKFIDIFDYGNMPKSFEKKFYLFLAAGPFMWIFGIGYIFYCFIENVYDKFDDGECD